MSPRLAIKQLKYLPAIFGSRPVVPAREDLREIVLNRVPAELQDAMLDDLVPDSGRAGKEMSINGVPVDRDRVRCPMLVIGSRDDRFIPVKIAERVARRYGAPFRILEGHGHMSIVEPGWETLADSIEQWIQKQT
jgi:pimeloyl-ACP methyl ester carboxylesterase